MPRGGIRAGAGRPPGSTHLTKLAVPADCDPLQFLLRVMRCEAADIGLRLKAAAALLPYVHARRAEVVMGRREQAQEAARTAGVGTEWGTDLLYQPATAPQGAKPADEDWGDDLRFEPMTGTADVH
jgi:hypothetical protein